MLQIFATIFFSVAALSTAAMMVIALVENWREVSLALGLGARTATLPAPARVPVSRPWSARSVAMPVRLRAAA